MKMGKKEFVKKSTMKNGDNAKNVTVEKNKKVLVKI